MTAQEMFKELGFRKNTSICYGVDHIVYEKAIGSEDDDCGFDIFTVEFKEGIFTYHNAWNSAIKTDKAMLKAINQQCEELGWLDE
jgi:hypothetical protein